MRVFDTFMFSNELDLLELRLRELDPVVDHFVLVEATTTHAGKVKPLAYAENRARFEPWSHKIIHVVVDDLPQLPNRWIAEIANRNAIARGLRQLREPLVDDDLVMISDVDEIPRRSVVTDLRLLAHGEVAALVMRAYFYRLNLRAGIRWSSARAVRGSVLQHLSPTEVRLCLPTRYVADVGWHFTWITASDDLATAIKAKAQSMAHREWDKPRLLDEKRLRRLADARVFWVTEFALALEPVRVDDTYPAPILENRSFWQPYMFNDGVVMTPHHYEYVATQAGLVMAKAGVRLAQSARARTLLRRD